MFLGKWPKLPGCPSQSSTPSPPPLPPAHLPALRPPLLRVTDWLFTPPCQHIGNMDPLSYRYHRRVRLLRVAVRLAGVWGGGVIALCACRATIKKDDLPSALLWGPFLIPFWQIAQSGLSVMMRCRWGLRVLTALKINYAWGYPLSD